MRIEHRRQKGIKGKELLRGEVPEKIDFDPERDLTSAQVTQLFEKLDEEIESRDWLNYERYFVLLQTLWPDVKGRELVRPPQDEVEKKLQINIAANRLDIWLDAISIRHMLGLPADVFLQPDLVKAQLHEFDLDCKKRQLDFTLPNQALAIARLGLRPLREVFLDREEAWKRCRVLLNSFHSADLGMYARLVVELRVLFPEHADEIRMEPEDIRKLKQNFLRVDPAAVSKVAETAFYLKLVTADRVELGPRGEYVASSAALAIPPGLPERDMT